MYATSRTAAAIDDHFGEGERSWQCDVRLSDRDTDALHGVLGEHEVGDLVTDCLEQLVVRADHPRRSVVQRTVVDDRRERRRPPSRVPDGDVHFDWLRMLPLMGEDANARMETHRAESDRFTG